MNELTTMSDIKLADFLFPLRGLLPAFVRSYREQQDIVDTIQQVLNATDTVGTFRELSAMSPELMERVYQALCTPLQDHSYIDKNFSFFALGPILVWYVNGKRLQAFGSKVMWHDNGKGLQGPIACRYGDGNNWGWNSMADSPFRCVVRTLNIPVNVPYPENPRRVMSDGSHLKNTKVRSIYMTARDFVVAIQEAGGNIVFVPQGYDPIPESLTLSNFLREAGGRFVTIEHSPYEYHPFDDL